MKKYLSLASVLLVLGCNQSGSEGAKKTIDKSSLATFDDKVSYAIGLDIGKNFTKYDNNFNMDVFYKGLMDGYTKSEAALMDSTEIKNTMIAFQKQMMEKQKAKFESENKQHKDSGAKFLADNKAKEGVITLASGLQYKIIKEGTGAKPAKTDNVKCHYEGKLVDGKVFDSSIKKGAPAEFPVNGVILGWQEALQLMPVGSKWELYIPYNLAYGERGRPGSIPPYSTLIFEIELLEIVKGGSKADPHAGHNH